MVGEKLESCSTGTYNSTKQLLCSLWHICIFIVVYGVGGGTAGWGLGRLGVIATLVFCGAL